ncbi:MAG: hypothetical protein JST85_10095 [Acidobacteria bacterium]|nr:hypothetical protein [Acidobacteriota bacterium]
MFVFLMSLFGIAAIVLALVVYVVLITTFMTWGSKLLNEATAKFENWLPQWVRENGWQLVEYRNDRGPNKLIWLSRRDTLYLWFVIRDQQEKEHVGWASYNYGPLGSGLISIRWESPEPPRNANGEEVGATTRP